MTNSSLDASWCGSEALMRSIAAVGVRSTARTDLRRTLHWSGVEGGAAAAAAASAGRWKWSKKSRLRETDANADLELLSVCSSSCKPNTKTSD
jgi:hypothetical protein